MPSIIVDSKRNCYVLQENSWEILEQMSARYTIDPGTYVLRIKSGSYSFFLNREQREPFVLIWLRGGSFINLATGVRTRVTLCSLNGYHDTLTIKVLEPTTVFALFIDSYKGLNRGRVHLSILPVRE